LLERVRRLDRFATKARFLRHDERLERRARLQRVHQLQESRSIREFGAADTVVNVNVLLKHLPAFSCRVPACVLHLTRDGALLIADAGLVGALAGVNGGSHVGASPLLRQGPISGGTVEVRTHMFARSQGQTELTAHDQVSRR
jgi:hypothetical protein